MICNNKCHNCSNIVFISNPSIVNGTLELAIPNMNICNNTKVCFIITGNLPTIDTPLPVKLSVNSTIFSYINKCGNYVYSDQITSRRLYVGSLKTDSLLFINSRCNLYSTSKSINCIPIPTPVAPAIQKVGDVK